MHPLRIARWNNGHHPGLDDGRRNLRSDVGGRADHRPAGAGPAAVVLGFLAPGSSERRRQRGRASRVWARIRSNSLSQNLVGRLLNESEN